MSLDDERPTKEAPREVAPTPARPRLRAKVRRAVGLGACLLVAAGAFFVSLQDPGDALLGGLAASLPLPPPSPLVPSPVEPLAAPPEDDDASCDTAEREIALPTGRVPALQCDQARTIVAQARSLLAVPSAPVDPQRFVTATNDWLDPHGLWSVAPDAPIHAVLKRLGDKLLTELEAAPGSGPCTAALEVGTALSTWVRSVRTDIEQARALGRVQTLDPKRRWDLASSTPYEDGTVTRKGRDLARLLGHGIGSVERAYGLTELADVAVDRAAPLKTDAEWSEALLAAAVRAYLPLLDAHGAWAPADEDMSIYDLDLEVDPPRRLWSEMTRTALGIRIDEGARAPLRNGDVVLRVGETAVAGLSVEQANQLAIQAEIDPTQVTLLRSGYAQPLDVEVSPGVVLLSPPPAVERLATLPAREVKYGDGYALVVKIRDVPDDLGERLRSTLFERPARKGSPQGILLDLRGNGGGSTDGALGALAVFLPGAALFPMKRRDGEIEIDRAPNLPEDSVWHGPVAALVDGDTASAAEMLAGAIAAYDRGVTLGAKTYGKGCAQEYLDDEAGLGVMRLTTLVFALPDGSPLQRVGVSPSIALGLPAANESEDRLTQSPGTWRGPDVRDRALIGRIPWPENKGRVGQSDDETIYRSLRALGAKHSASR